MPIFSAILLATAQSVSLSACVGDFIYQGKKESEIVQTDEGTIKLDETSIGVRVRSNLDIAEISWSDYSEVISRDVVFDGDTAVIHDWDSKQDYILICQPETATLITPTTEYSKSKKYLLRRVEGDLWEVGMREGWLVPEDS